MDRVRLAEGLRVIVTDQSLDSEPQASCMGTSAPGSVPQLAQQIRQRIYMAAMRNANMRRVVTRLGVPHTNEGLSVRLEPLAFAADY